jgi:hypothetical protein
MGRKLFGHGTQNWVHRQGPHAPRRSISEMKDRDPTGDVEDDVGQIDSIKGEPRISGTAE